jgi:hypothetical protein
MPAPTYTWEFVTDLLGDRVPKIVALEATSGLYTKVGTAVIAASGQVDEATASVVLFLGLAAEEISNATAADPVKVALIAPGMVIKGTSDADASTASGFSGKTFDFNSDGSMDYADSSAGCLSVWRTEDAGLTVYCVVNGQLMAVV